LEHASGIRAADPALERARRIGLAIGTLAAAPRAPLSGARRLADRPPAAAAFSAGRPALRLSFRASAGCVGGKTRASGIRGGALPSGPLRADRDGRTGRS